MVVDTKRSKIFLMETNCLTYRQEIFVELSFEHTIITSILAIMAKNIDSFKKYEISENSFELNIDYCIKIGI